MSDEDHQFGALHTAIKLNALARYLPAYTTALKNAGFALHYIDAFAGTGSCRIQTPNGPLRIPGSASIALDCTPPFHRMVFVERKRRHVAALERLVAACPGRPITILHEDANTALPRCLDPLNDRKDRAVVFLDPYGMSVDWATLSRIGASHLADVWYLFPLSGLYRQAARNADDIDSDKAAALTRMLGTDAWREAFYKVHPQMSLLGETPKEVRVAEHNQMLAWVKKHLESIFAGVAPPKLLFQRHASGKLGAPLFALFFAVSNPSPKALGLAMKIAKHILKD